MSFIFKAKITILWGIESFLAFWEITQKVYPIVAIFAPVFFHILSSILSKFQTHLDSVLYISTIHSVWIRKKLKMAMAVILEI